MAVTQISRLHLVALTCLPIAGALLNGFYNGPLYRMDPALYWTADFLLYVLAPTAVVVWLARFSDVRPKHYGLKFPPYGGLESVAASVFLAIILFTTYKVASYLGWIFTWRWYTEPDFSYAAVTPAGVLRPLAAFYWATSAGVVESIFYIGLPWYLWRHHFGLAHRRRLFLWVSATVFAAAHWEQGPHNVIAALAFGLVACLLYWKINDLWPVVGAHTLVDLVIFL